MAQTPTTWLGRTLVNPDTTGFQGQQQVIGLSNGNILVVYADDSNATSASSGRDITGVIYDAEGNVVVSAFEVNTSFFADSEDSPSIAATSDGGFVMAFEDTNANGTAIRVERYDASGNQIDSGTVAADPGAGILNNPQIALNRADNSIFVTFERNDGGDNTIRGVKMDADLNVVGTEQILRTDEDPTNTQLDGDPLRNDTAVLANGTYVTVFDEGDIASGTNDQGIELRLSSAAGVNGANLAVTALNGVQDSHARVAALSDGGFVVVWVRAGTDVVAQRFEANGTARGGEIDVASTGNNHGSPDVIGLEDGSFFIAWQDLSFGEIEGQLYSGTTGATIGSEINVTTTDAPQGVNLDTTTDGRILVTYQTTVPFNDVQFSIFDPRDGTITANAGDGQITGRLEGSTIIGSGASERLLGQGGNDVFQYVQNTTGGSNVDTIEGGGGVNTFEFTTLQDKRVVDLAAGHWALGSIDSTGSIRGLLTDIQNVTVLAQDVRGSAANNIIIASGSFANAFEGGGGFDTMTGGGGADRFIFNNAAEIGNALNARDVVTDFSQADGDQIDLDDFDALTTQGGVQHFTWLGTAGHTGAGATLRFIHSGGNTLIYGDVDANGSGDFTLQLNGIHNLTAEDFTDLSIAAVQGTNAGEILAGSSKSETVIGLNGNDTLFGNGGADTLRGGNGADTMTGGAGNDRFDFNSQAEIGNALNARDVITDFTQGADLIDLDGVDALTTSAGVQHFTWLGTAAHTGAGATLRFSQAGGNTLIFGDTNADGAGDFTIELTGLYNLTAADFTVATIARIHGTSGNDTLNGMPGGKTMTGFEGDDTIIGGAGADTIQGGVGFDQMTGGLGFDVFDINAVSHIGLTAGSRDIITDFQQGVDRIDLADIDAHTIIGGNQAFAFIGAAAHSGAGGTLRAIQSGGNTLVSGDVNADGVDDFVLQLTGLYTLNASDFAL